MFDLGVVDLHQRGRLDIFTTNHNSRQSLLENDGKGRFTDAPSSYGLDQDVGFPGWANDVDVPSFSRPGLYVYRHRNALILRAVGRRAQFSGTLELRSPMKIAKSGVAVTVEQEGSEPARLLVRFSAAENGELSLRPNLFGLPVDICIDPDVALNQVFVGPTMTCPSKHSFTLKLQDRHGMAWADFNRDGRIDAFVGRGGLRGRLADYAGEVQDELLVNRGSYFEDRLAGSGINKGLCRSRQASWVFLGRDDGLHLFVSCLGSAPQVYRARPDGRFSDVTADLGLLSVRGQHFAWADVDDDGQPELLAVQDDSLVVYHRSDGGPFELAQAVALRGNGASVERLAIGDYDGDGDADLFLPSPAGNTLLVNDRGVYRAMDPSEVGLPGEGGVTANWVDFDNDGRVDLHVVPGGLFRQGSDGRFTKSDLLDDHGSPPVADARVSWFDANGDGTRDVLIATVAVPKGEPGGFDWNARLLRNRDTCNHWLQIDLRGAGQNPHALGGRVEVRAGDRTQTQHVGFNEGSHYSQGHYRLYFGLGASTQAESVTIRWPDGSISDLGPTAADQLLVVSASVAR